MYGFLMLSQKTHCIWKFLFLNKKRLGTENLHRLSLDQYKELKSKVIFFSRGGPWASQQPLLVAKEFASKVLHYKFAGVILPSSELICN